MDAPVIVLRLTDAQCAPGQKSWGTFPKDVILLQKHCLMFWIYIWHKKSCSGNCNSTLKDYPDTFLDRLGQKFSGGPTGIAKPEVQTILHQSRRQVRGLIIWPCHDGACGYVQVHNMESQKSPLKIVFCFRQTFQWVFSELWTFEWGDLFFFCVLRNVCS